MLLILCHFYLTILSRLLASRRDMCHQSVAVPALENQKGDFDAIFQPKDKLN